jgi:hypothetical protein
MPARTACLAVLLTLTAPLIWVQPARAQWAPNGAPVCTPPGLPSGRSLVSDGAGGVIVSWVDSRGTSPQIYAQHLDSSGSPMWEVNGIPLSSGLRSNTMPPCLASDGSGGAIVLWVADSSLYAQRINGAGDLQWGSGGRAVLSASSGSQPIAAVEDGSGGVVFEWVTSYPTYVYCLQRLDSSGAPLWVGNGVQAPTWAAVLTPDGSGGAIFAWSDSARVRVQRFAGDGTAQWGPSGLLVSACASSTYRSTFGLTSDGSGGAIVAWMPPWDCARASRSYAQRVTADGSLAWPGGVSLAGSDGGLGLLTLVSDGAHGAIVAMGDSPDYTSQIYAQRISAAGALLWPYGGVPVCVAREYRSSPAVVADGAGGAILAWTDNRRGNSQCSTSPCMYTWAWDIYVQHLDSAGQARWTPNGVLLRAAPIIQSQDYRWPEGAPSIVSAGTGGAVFVWNDERFSPLGAIYAQHVPASGSAPYIEDVAPRVTSVRDVPNDQGGRVFLTWVRSGYDYPGARFITGYAVWRRVPPPASDVTARAGGAASIAPSAPLRVVRVNRPDGRVDITYWEQVATLRAEGLEGYGYTAPTTQDSIVGSNPYTAFFVTALTADPFVFFESAPDSGYSVDNVAPPTPVPFTAAYSPTSVALHWAESPAADFREFRLYRGPIAGFAPGPTNLVVASRDTGYVDAAGGGNFYKLAAVDIHGNQSLFALVSPTGPVATLASLASIDAWPDRIRLTWYAAGNPGVTASVYRRSADADWAALGHITADGAGYLRYEDTAVQVGMRYGYRLGIMDGGIEVFVGEAWAAAAQFVFALQGAWPNPAEAGNLRVHFTLPTTEPAKLELVDVAGRRVAWRDVGSLGPGPHVTNFGESGRIPPGIYLVRLTQGQKVRVTRVAVLD